MKLSTILQQRTCGVKPALQAWGMAVLMLCITATFGHAQVAVTVDFPTNTTPALAPSYPSLSAAITALSGITAISGPVTLTAASGTETAPAGGYVINFTAATTAANNVVITGTTTTTITASAGHTVGAVNDAIFKIIGSDFVTIQNFTMQENPANTTTTPGSNNMTEFGVALLYASATNGSQNNTIQNNIISLNRNYSNTFGIYSNVRHTATNVGTTADITSPSGSNSNNKVYGNTISNVNYGIVFIGSSTAANMDSGNDIGGTGASSGNTITNWGGHVSGAPSTFISLTGTSTCIFMNHQTADNVSYNVVTSAAVTTLSGTTGLSGIIKAHTAGNPSGTFTSNYNNNTVTLTFNPSATGNTGQVTGMGLQGVSSGGGGITFNCNDNLIVNCSIGGATASSNALVGMLHSSAVGTLNCNNNTLRGFNTTATSGSVVGIQQQTNAVVTAINMNNNKLGDGAAGFVNYANTSAQSGALTGIAILSAGAAAATCVTSVQNNDIRGINYTATGSGAHTYYNVAGGSACNISNNTFTNLNVNTTGSVTFISASFASNATTGFSKLINSNSIVGSFNKGGAGGTVTLYNDNASSTTTIGVQNNNNNFSNITVTGATTIAGWSNTDGTGATPQKTFTGNTFTNWTGGTGSITCLNNSFGNLITLSNNTINNITGQGAITGISIGSSGTYSTAASVTNNTITNLSSTGTGGAVTGLSYAAPAPTSGTNSVSNNTINTLSSTSTTATVAGISSSGSGVNISNHTIYGLSCTGTSSGVTNGIMITGGNNVSVFKNKIYDLQTTGAFTTTPGVNGIVCSGSTSSVTVNVFNNLIGDLKAPASTSTDAIRGISVTATGTTSTYNVSFNTVYLAATGGATFGTSGIFHTASTTATTATLNLRNNIIVNNSVPGGSGLTVAYRRSAGTANTLNNYGSTSNNNLFYAGAPGPSNLIYSDGTSTATTLAAYQAGAFTAGTVAPRDAVSVTENPPFLSTTGSSANFLHIDPSVATQIESGAAPIAGITDDFDGDTRNATTPDIGADEGNFILADLTPPSITYTPLGNTSCTLARTLTASITDASGVPTSGIGLPVLYWRINMGPWTPVTGTHTGGSNYDFTFGAGAVTGDVVQYYIVAQDNAATPNVGAFPSVGAGGFTANPPAAATPPTTPSSYTIIAPGLSGTVTIGATGTYPTLTGAGGLFAAINTNGLAGNLTANIIDASITETGANALNAIASTGCAAGPHNLLIKPTVTATLTGSVAGAIIRLNGADNVTIDGSIGSTPNTVCPPSSATRDLTITNTSTSTTSAVVWLQSSGTDGATNNTVMNCNIVGSGVTQTLFGIGAGSSTIGTSSLGTGNNNNAYINNNISGVQYGIYTQGASASNKNIGTVINQNLINTSANTRGGIWTGFENNITISGNNISNIAQSSSPDVFGITCGFGTAVSATTTSGNEVTNATITNNVIGSVVNTGTFSAYGIGVASATSGTTLIANNMISGVSANGTGGDISSGIILGGGTGSTTNVYHNTVHMQGTIGGGTAATQTSACLMVTNSTTPTLNVVNNIFVNTQVGNTGATLRFATQAVAFGSYTGFNSNNNDLFCAGGGPGTYHIGITGGVVSGTSRTTLSDWQTATGQDAASVNTSPVFVSVTDLHLVPAANAALNDLGVPVGISADIDCDTRSATTPDMGADEFSLPCSMADGGIAMGPAGPFCGSASGTITATGYSTGAGTTYVWQSSTSPSFTSPVNIGMPSATYSDLSFGPITSTTYYRLRVACSNDMTEAFSTIVPITVINLSTAPGEVVIVNSTCQPGCTVGGGSIAPPAMGCPLGSTLQYSTDGGTTWSTTLPTYNQTGPAQNIRTQCACDFNPTITSPASAGVTTVPGSCTPPAAPTGMLAITNSTCQPVCTVGGGSIAIGTVTGTGGTLEFSEDGGATWSPTLPTYNQTGPAQTITARVTDANGCTSSSTTVGTTSPGSCPTLSAPTGMLAITNSTCQPGCTVGGGSIAIGTVTGTGGTLEFSQDGGTTWSATLPAYNQTGPAQTITARVTDANGCTSSSTTVGTTSPGSCPTLSAPTGMLAITNSTCQPGCTVGGGSIAIGTVTGTGGTLEFSQDGGTTWSPTLPTYNQTGPAQTITARVTDANGCTSSSTTVGTTSPGSCTPPAAPTGALAITNSTCQPGCTVGGGSIAIGTVTGTGGTLEFSEDGGATWSPTLPTYNQTGPAQTIIARVTDANGCTSSSTTVGTTAPGSCPTLSAPTGALAITNSTCQPGCTVGGGSIAIGTVTGTGGTLEFSEDGGATWSPTLPTYNQTGPAQAIIARVTDANGCTSSSATVGTTAPGTCIIPGTPTLTIIDNVCPSTTGTISATGCGAGTVAEYALAPGGPWSATPPAYTMTSFTVYARCRNTTTDCVSSTVSGTTSPTTCVTCPTLTTPGEVVITNSACQPGCTVGGGSIAPPAVGCPGGSTLEYSTDGGTTWSTTLPTYNQTGPAQNIRTRCRCDIDPSMASAPSAGVTTSPGSCPTLSAPTGALAITNSTCQPGCTVGGGSIAIGTVTGTGGTLEFSQDGGTTWSPTLPTYNQTGPAQTIIARVTDANGCTSSSTTVGTTSPGSCTPPAAPTGMLAITNSTCQSGCTVGGGSIAIGTVTGTGGTLEYSQDGGMTWSATLPAYNQTGPAQTITARVTDANGCTSSSATVGTTAPGTCIIPGPPTLTIIDNVCPSTTGTITATGCGAGTVAEYALTPGGPWSATPPAYTASSFTVYARCRNTTTDCTSSVVSGTTSPVACCPTLSTAPGEVQITNSTCGTGCTVGGGSIAPPTTGCPSGSTIQYSTDGGTTWSTTLPTYNQTGPAQNILTRCICDNDASVTSPASAGVTTVPGTCTPPTIIATTTTPPTCPGGSNGTLTISASSSSSPLTYAISGPVSGSNATGSFSGLLTGTYSITVTDVNGCTATGSANVSAGTDTTPPSITCPGTQTLMLGGSACTATLPDYTGLATTSDSCSTVTLTQSPTAGTTVSGAGPMTVTLTATDASGNSAICSFTVNKTAPPATITCPANQSLTLGASCSATLPNYTGLVTATGCGTVTVTQSPAAGTTVSGAGPMTVTFTATDGGGNTAQCSITVNKVDTTPPTVTCNNTTITFNGEPSITLSATALVTATDNCGIASITLSPSVINCNQVGQVVPVTVTVTDVNSNVSTCTANVTVGGFPCGWSYTPGLIACDGAASYNPGTGVWTNTAVNCFYPNSYDSDSKSFIMRPLCGNGSITVQVTSISPLASGWAGIVMRDGTAPGAKKIQLMTNLSNFHRREVRYVTNGTAYPQQVPANFRYWLRLVRQGNQFTGFVSPDGVTWFFAMAAIIDMPNCIDMGLVVTNYTPISTVTATFANVSTTGSLTPLMAPAVTEERLSGFAPEFDLYPNPTNGQLNLDLKEYLGRAVRIEVYSLEGKLVQFSEVDAVQTPIETFEMKARTSGMYLVKVKSAGLPDAVRRVVLNR